MVISENMVFFQLINFSNSNSTRSERIKSEGDIKITKGKSNNTLGKKCTLISDSLNDNEVEATMLTQVIEHDHNEDTRKAYYSNIKFRHYNNISKNPNDVIISFNLLSLDGMQQFMVESEGGTVLIDCTNVTIVKADQTANKP